MMISLGRSAMRYDLDAESREVEAGKMPRTIVLLTKLDRFSDQAVGIAKQAFGERVEHLSGKTIDPMPERLEAGAEVLISFLSPWIVPKRVLDRCDTAINFHPASTDYPGSGCYNFALYDKAAEYGATCHHMLPKVDTGRVILERRFPIATNDSVETLKLNTMVTMLAMFDEIVTDIAQGRALPVAPTHWTRKPSTFRQMEALKVIEPTMGATEIERRLRATIYPGYPGPVLRYPHGQEAAYPVPQRAAVA